MSEKGKRDVIEAIQSGLPGSVAGPIPSTKKMKKVKEKKKRVRKRDRLRRLTRKQIEKMLAKAKKTWLSMNEILKDGEWDKSEEDGNDE